MTYIRLPLHSNSWSHASSIQNTSLNKRIDYKEFHSTGRKVYTNTDSHSSSLESNLNQSPIRPSTLNVHDSFSTFTTDQSFAEISRLFESSTFHESSQQDMPCTESYIKALLVDEATLADDIADFLEENSIENFATFIEDVNSTIKRTRHEIDL